MPSRRALLLLALSVVVILAAASLFPRMQTFAAPALQETPTPEQPPAATQPPTGNLSIADDVCLGCHGQPGQTMTLENGEILDLYVPPELHQGSIHGQLGYACVQCHTTVGEYPHPKFTASDKRNVTEQISETCARCHRQQNDFTKDSAHQAARERGVREAALCVDCHTAHEVRQLHDPKTGQLLKTVKTWIPERCALCHNAIYQKYRQSVHGSALSEGNPDVPTCIDCHGVHNIADPRTAAFRLKSPEICAKCHTNPALMSKYGLPTDVLNTYVADFHGQTVALFEKQSPDAQVNKPVCYDCHGVHDISRVDDPHTGLEMQQNLLARCQVCHPDASTNFPTAWMSHYIPSPQHYALVYYVNLFYKFFIPLTLGAMGLLVVMDASRTLINRTRRRRKVARHPKEDMAEAKPVQAVESHSEAAVSAPEAPVESASLEVIPPGDVEPAGFEEGEPPDALPPAADEATGTQSGAPDQPASEPPEIDASDSEVEHG